MRFSFEVKISEQDYYAFNLFTSLGTKEGKKNYNRGRVFIVVFVLLAGVLLSLLSETMLEAWVTISTFAVAAVVGAICHRPLIKHIVKLTIKNMKKNGRLPYTQEAMVAFSDESILEESPMEKAECKYTIIEAIYLVNNSMFYIYSAQNKALLLPVSAFTDATQLEEFKAFISEKTVPLTVCQFHA